MCVYLYDIQTKQVFSDRLGMTFLKIPMMDKTPEECRTMLEKWLYILKNMDKMDMIPQNFMNESVFRRLGDVARFAALTERDKKAYKESLKVYRDNYAIAETERNEGRAEGLAEGIAKGRAEGSAEGTARTIAEKARQAKELGLPDDLIARLFGNN